MHLKHLMFAISVLVIFAAQASWAQEAKSKPSLCDMYDGGEFILQPDRDKGYDTSESSDESRHSMRTYHDVAATAGVVRVEKRLTTVKLSGRCVPTKTSVRTIDSSLNRNTEETEWSLEDCYALRKVVSDSDLEKCQVIDDKLQKALHRSTFQISEEYGMGSRLSGLSAAAIIRDRCNREPLTAILLKDAEVQKYLLLRASKPQPADQVRDRTKRTTQ